MTQKTTSDRAFQLSLSGQRAPVDYERAPTYSGMIAEKDVLVPMRDGVKIAIDIYRPDTTDKLPALLALSIHNKDLQGPERRRRHCPIPPGPCCGPARRKRATRAFSSHAATRT